jgi:hypothetical protein
MTRITKTILVSIPPTILERERMRLKLIQLLHMPRMIHCGGALICQDCLCSEFENLLGITKTRSESSIQILG